ncbi:MAG: DNA-binding protein [Bacteroidaceae bacterium]|nr:DNA-binding protein [Bacteroidaceae bacterium]
MPINYSLVSCSNPSDMAAAKKIYPRAQYAEVMSLTEFSRHIANHGSCFSRATIQAVLTEAVDCLREQLLLGNRVQLGELGTFYVSLRSSGSDTAEGFSAAMINDVKLKLMPSMLFTTLVKDASFHYVASRKAQAEARKDEKVSIDGGSGTNEGDNVVTD